MFKGLMSLRSCSVQVLKSGFTATMLLVALFTSLSSHLVKRKRGPSLISLLLLMVLMPLSAVVQATDLLIITKIQNVKSAGGLDGYSTAGFAALGAAIAVKLETKKGKPLTALEVINAAQDGGEKAIEVAEFLDDQFSGQDDLIVKVNGKTVWPTSGTFQPMDAGDVIFPDIRVSFEQGAIIQLVEYDSGSDNDDLGSIYLLANINDVLEPGNTGYSRDDAIIIAPAEEDGSVYYVSYRVERNVGSAADVTKFMLCGTNQCDACTYINCAYQSYSELDRDGDKGDLKACLPPYETKSFIKYPQAFFLDDVYLRVCGLSCPTLTQPSGLNYTISTIGRPLITWADTANAYGYEITVRDAGGNIVSKVLRYGNASGYTPEIQLPPGTYTAIVRVVSSASGSGDKFVNYSCQSPFSEILTIDIPKIPVLLDIEQISADVAGLGSGSVKVFPAPFSQIGGNFYIPGDVVTLIATPTERAEFQEWIGDAASCGTSAICPVTIIEGSGMNVQAIFRPKPTLLVVTPAASLGTVAISPQGPSCSNDYTCAIYSTGTTVTMTPTPTAMPGSVFDSWGGDEDCLDGSVSMAKSLICYANFKRTNYELSVTQSIGSEVISDPTGEINCGTQTDCNEIYQVSAGEKTVVLNASITPDWVFVRWSGSKDCWNEDENDNDPLRISVTVGAKDVDCSVIAVPEGTEYALTIEKLGGGSVKAEALPITDSSGIDCPLNACSQNYPVNTQVQLTAKASKGAEFVGFESPNVGSDNYVREDDDCIDGQINMIESISCIASFKSNVLVVKGSNTGEGKEQNPYIGVLNNQDLVDYDIWDVKSPNSGDNSTDPVTNSRRVEPVTEDLAKYGRVIWYTGITSEDVGITAGPSAAAEASLSTYLDNGGCLMMSSPNYHKDRGLTSFMQTYLGVSSVTDDVEESRIKGAGDLYLGFSELTTNAFSGTPNEGFFSFQGDYGPYTSDSMVHNPEVPGSNVLFTYRDGEGEAAVAVDNGTYRTAFLGFPFLGLSSGDAQNNTMRAFLDLCGQPERDDLLEDNDDFDGATERQGAVSLKSLKILSGNDDYFKWVSDWSADAGISILFQHATGDLALEVYDENQLLISSSDTQDDNESVVLDNVDAGKTYYIRVYGIDGSVSNVYDLDITQLGLNDIDFDGVPDVDDALPNDPLEQADVDADGIGDNADLDNDNDGMTDAYEILNELDPFVAAGVTDDTDSDGFTDLDEFLAGSKSNDPDLIPFIIPIESLIGFDDEVNVPLNTQIVSNSITVAVASSSAVGISVNRGEYEINGSDIWLTTDDTVVNNDTVKVRHTSSSSSGIRVDTVLSIDGSIRDTFSSTTSGLPPIVTRAEISKEILLAKYGFGFELPVANGTVYTDVGIGDFNADWIEKLAVDGITEGCATKKYCPDMVVTKEQLAKILLKAKHGSDFNPPDALGTVFSDVSTSSFNASWIEALSNQGITEGCGNGSNFCPRQTVTLEGFIQMLNKTFPE
ncbi:MAG: hypothetical protein V7784_22980 [Oceanospirillaceae bacterium]